MTLIAPHSTEYMAEKPREMEAKCLDRYAGQTGGKRGRTIDYMRGLISGRYGTVSQAGRDYARRVLDAMGA